MTDTHSYRIQINSQCPALDVDESILRRAIIEALRRFDVRGAELSVALISDQAMADLHQRHLGRAGPTDVLTFDLATPAPSPAAARKIEGEVVISVDTARRCARQRGHSPAAEMTLYAVHGVLHLLGLNDHPAESAAQMHALEDDILTAVGLGRIYEA